MHRRSRPFFAVLAILALFFAQLMASVHACDIGSTVASAAVVGSEGAPADCCDHGTPAPDPLCDNHCQQGKQAPERTQTATLTPLLAGGSVVPSLAVVFTALSASVPSAPDLARDTEPPIPIRNCCFRI